MEDIEYIKGKIKEKIIDLSNNEKDELEVKYLDEIEKAYEPVNNTTTTSV